MRQSLVVLHRWAGLASAMFLLLAGLTGSLIAFEKEIDAGLNPRLFTLAAPLDEQGRQRPMLDAFELRSRVAAALPAYFVDRVQLHPQPDRPTMFRLRAKPGIAATLNQAFVDPYTGALLGTRHSEWTFIGFIYRLHYSLALPGPWGEWLLGVIAIIWTLDSFAGLILTLPRGGPFWSKWRTAWKIKRNAAAMRLNLDLHRAFGLWLWLVVLLYAWSSVMLNLRQEFYRPVMSTMFRFAPQLEPKALPQPRDEPRLNWQQALAAGRSAMRQLAAEKQFVVHYEDVLAYNRNSGSYVYVANTSRDIVRDRGQTSVYLDGDTGARLGFRIQTGEAAGDTISRWLQSLHMAQIGGLPYQIFVSCMGCVVALLSVTGVVVWWHKRSARVASAARSAALARSASASVP